MPKVAKKSKCSQTSIYHPLRVLVRPRDRGATGHTHTKCGPTGTHSTKPRAETPYMPNTSLKDFSYIKLCRKYARHMLSIFNNFYRVGALAPLPWVCQGRTNYWRMHLATACVPPPFHGIRATSCRVLTRHGYHNWHLCGINRAYAWHICYNFS